MQPTLKHLPKTPLVQGEQYLFTPQRAAHSPSPVTADSLLLRMEALWEAVVRRMVVEVAAGMHGRPVPSSGGSAIKVSGDLSSHSPFRPDVLLCFANTPPRFLAVDAKYKRYDNRSISAGDIHQMLTYTAGYSPDGTGAAVVVHPSPSGATHRRLRVTAPRGQLAELHVAGIDVRLSPQDAAQALAPVLASALHSTGRTPARTLPPEPAQPRATEGGNVSSPRSTSRVNVGTSPGREGAVTSSASGQQSRTDYRVTK